VHYSPLPDPDAQWRGMSWLTPVLREIQADTATTRHKLRFFENGASPSFGLKYDPALSPQQVREYKAMFDEANTGTDKAYKVLHIGGGVDPFSIGANMQQLDFRAVQGAGETRIAAAAGVGAIIARFSEGLQGSALNQGNYAAAKRQFADMTLRPLWRTAASALSKFASPPSGSRLWIDVRDIAFLAEDQKNAAEILASKAATIRQLVDAGYDPDAAVRAVQNDDLSLLTGAHSGLFSVQLQPAGAQATPTPPGGQP
jgi:phage portal protein BeeE